MSENNNKDTTLPSPTLIGACTIGAVVLYSVANRFLSNNNDDQSLPSLKSKSRRGSKSSHASSNSSNSLKSLNNSNSPIGSNDLDVDHTISNSRVVKMRESIYVKPKSMYFEQCGKTRRWDLIESFSVVCGLAYDVQKDSFLFVKQFRPPVYHSHKRYNTYDELNKKYPNEQIGVTYELCAGIMDKDNLSPKETMKEEFYEECGYEIPLSKIHEIATYRASTGVMGNHTYVYVAFISDSMKVNLGGGDENENIELIWVPLNDSKKFIMDPDKDIPPGLKFAVFWFYDRYKDLCKDVKNVNIKHYENEPKPNKVNVEHGKIGGRVG